MEIVSAINAEKNKFSVKSGLNKDTKYAKQLKKATAIMLLKRETKADKREKEAVAPNK